MPLSYEDQNDNVTVTDDDGDQLDLNADGSIPVTGDLSVADGTELNVWNDDMLEIMKNIRTELRAIRLYLNLASLDTVENRDLMEDLED